MASGGVLQEYARLGVGGKGGGTSDWAIRSVSLRGQGKVMKSGGEPSSSLQTQILKEITRPFEQRSPLISAQEAEKRVRSAEGASVRFGRLPTGTKCGGVTRTVLAHRSAVLDWG